VTHVRPAPYKRLVRLIRIAVGVCAAALVVAFAGVGRPDTAGSAGPAGSRTITVTGMGSITVVPNRAAFSFGVTTQGRTAAAALAENAAQMRKVIAALKGEGIAAADIQTQSVSLSPRYSNDGEMILGYTASNSVSATAKDINKAGLIVDAAVAAGANQVSGPSLTRGDSVTLYRRALQAAVADARAKAAAIASASRARLGVVRSVTEGSSAPVPIPFAGKAAAAPDSTPVEPGTQQIQASVTVEFAIS
jgi:uncharacterized protein YggE